MNKKTDPVRTGHWNEKTQLIIRLSSLALPIVIIAYSAIVRFGILNVTHPPINTTIGNWDFFVISFLFVGWGIWQFIFSTETKSNVVFKVVSAHVIFSLMFIFVLGTSTPLVMFWMLIAMEAYTYLLNKGYWGSIVILALTVYASNFVWQRPTTENVAYGIIMTILVYYLSAFVISSSKTNVVERQEINTAKTKEALQRDRIVTIINNLADAIISTDMEGIIRVSNAASLNLLDTNSSLIGRNIDSVLPIVDQEGQPISLLEEFQKTKTSTKRDDISYTFDDGETIRLEIIFSPIRSNYTKKDTTHDGYVAILRDVTKEKSLEEERDEFISVTSHELRTPLTVAEGAVSNVKAMLRKPGISIDVLENNVDMAHDQITFLANMVNDLNALSRAERNINSTEDIDLKDLSKKLYEKYSGQAKSKKLKFDLILSPKLDKITVNKLYIEEILQNLIMNAIKYTNKGSVKISIIKQGTGIKFSVKDTGIGISRTDKSRLFGKFYRSEDYRTRETGGTGLGLYVAAKLARKIGTKIQFTSRLNIGSTFWFVLKNK